jgi:hypothetical protein
MANTEEVESEEYDSIYVLMGKILGELPAIGKNQRNEQQGFNFRGIDDVLDALNPIMGQYGVFCVPYRVVEVTPTSDRTTRAGSTMYATHLTMEYRFYGPRGDYVQAVGIGEGTDSLDKSAPKAMTGAYKYMLFETFAISTKEASDVDADRGGGQDTIATKPLNDDELALIKRLNILPPEWKDKVMARMANRYNEGEPFEVNVRTMPSGHPGYRILEEYLDAVEAKMATEAQDADAEAGAVQGEPPARVADKPAPEPPAAATPPETDTPAPTPAAESEPEPEPEGDEEEDDTPSWEEVVDFSMTKLKNLLKELGAKSQAYNAKNGVDRRNYYWLAIGGEFEANEPPFADGWDCPFCQISIAYDNQEELTQHMIDQHSGDDDLEDDSAESGTAGDTGTVEDDTDALGNPKSEDDPVIDAATLSVVQEEVTKLKGTTARAYAEYRRKKGLPADFKDLTLSQGLELIDFIGSLTAA